jgi:hypothetical protein
MKDNWCRSKVDIRGMHSDSISIKKCNFEEPVGISGIFKGGVLSMEIDSDFERGLRISPELLTWNLNIEGINKGSLSLPGIYTGKINIGGEHKVIEMLGHYLHPEGVSLRANFAEFISNKDYLRRLAEQSERRIYSASAPHSMLSE